MVQEKKSDTPAPGVAAETAPSARVAKLDLDFSQLYAENTFRHNSAQPPTPQLHHDVAPTSISIEKVGRSWTNVVEGQAPGKIKMKRNLL